SSNKNSEEPSTSNTPVKIEVPSELPKFDKSVHDEITEVQIVFTQIETAMEQDIVNIVLNSSVFICDSEKKNDDYIELLKQFSNLEQHCISIEVSMQLNQESFQKDKSCDNPNDPEIQEYFEQNDLQVQLQAKDTVISKLKETIHSLRDNANPARVKHDTDEIERINIELEYSIKAYRQTKNNRISQPSSSNKTNKVEDQSRSVKSWTNKKNRVSKTKCNADVIHSMLNANSKSVCAICNECLFDATHDKCVLDYVHDVTVLSKSKPAKRKNKNQIWKPTGKVYTEIGYKWKPTRQTFTIVENKCPLTRFTSTKVVPLKETTIKLVLTPTPGIKVYSRRPKATNFIGSSSKSKIIESRISNKLEPTQTRGSTVSNVPSSSLIYFRLSKFFSGIWTPDALSI
ncbi:hypothetical protein Tco_1356612, partial [Tanacetum coccineum]